MWSWDNRKAQTLSPRSATRSQYSTHFNRDPYNKSPTSSAQISQDSRPDQRLPYSGIPWGYFTTRRAFTTPFTGSLNKTPGSNDAALTKASSFRFSPGQQDQARSQPQHSFDRPLSQPPLQHQYSSKQTALTPVSRKTPTLPVKPQAKQAPIRKRIDRTKRDKSRYSHTNSFKQVTLTKNMSVNPLFEDSSTAPVHDSSRTGLLRDKPTTRDKWHEEKSNSAVRAEFVDNSIYQSSRESQLLDSDHHSVSDVNSDPRDNDDVNNFDQQIVNGEGVPLYARVFKNKQEQQEKPEPLHASKPYSPAKSGKKDEPVYSTIGDRKGDVTKTDEQSSPAVPTSDSNNQQQQYIQANSMSSFNLQSVKDSKKQMPGGSKQGRELPPKKMSVLDELKLRFAGKKAFSLKSTKPADVEKSAVVDDSPLSSDINTGFNPLNVVPPPPPSAEPLSDPQSPFTIPIPSNTPPPPRFAPPPPPPSAVITDPPEMYPAQTSSPDARPTEVTEQASTEPPVYLKEVLLSNMNDPGTASVPIEKDNNSGNYIESSTSKTGVVDLAKDPTGRQSDIQDESEDSSDESSLYSNDSEYTSSQRSSAQVRDGIPRSILKNRYETPLVNPEKLIPLSDSENEDDNTLSQKGQTQDLSALDDDYISNSLDRRGVCFSNDTLDNEGRAKKYEKEGFQLHKIDTSKTLPSEFTVPKPPFVANKEELVKPEPASDTGQTEVIQPSDVPVTVEDAPNEEAKEEVTKDENQVSTIPLVNDVVDAPTSLKPDVLEDPPPQRYIFTSSRPEIMQITPKANGVTVLNGTLPSRSLPALVTPPVFSSTLDHSSTPKHPELYFTLSRKGDNVSVVNISQDDMPLDNVSQRLTLDRYSRDTLRSNISIGTMRTMISIGGASDLNDTQPTAYPGGEDDTLEHTLPFKVEMFEYKKHQTRTGKYQKKVPHSKERNGKHLKKTTFADQALGYDAQIKREKKKQKNRRICRIASFVVVVVIILVTAVLIVYFLLENDQNSSEQAVTATPN